MAVEGHALLRCTSLAHSQGDAQDGVSTKLSCGNKSRPFGSTWGYHLFKNLINAPFVSVAYLHVVHFFVLVKYKKY